MPFSEAQRVAIAGSGFLADAYDLYVIGQVQPILFKQFSITDTAQQDHLKSILSSAALIGAVMGQLTFGALADWMGRRIIFLITGSTIVVGAVLSGLSQERLFPGSNNQVFYQIAAARFILGVGIGGEYPLSATIASESCTARRRGTLMASVFAMQGAGYLLSSTVMLILVLSSASPDFTWRFALAFGGFVPLISMYFRWQMEENDAFKEVQEARAKQQETVTQSASAWKYRWHILGTATNWAVFDIVFYANGLFNSDVTKAIQFGSGEVGTMLKTFLIVLIQLPGYIVAVLTINRIGRKPMQLMGFFMMFVLFLIIGLLYEVLVPIVPLFIAVYGLTFFFANFGPNTTTYIIPGEIYPSQIKATTHGVSAAAGKLGATVGASCFELFHPGKSTAGLKHAMLACSACALFGFLTTTVFTPHYEAEDLEKKEEGETVGFVPLFGQQPNGDRVQGLSCFCVAYIEVPDSHVELTTDVN